MFATTFATFSDETVNLFKGLAASIMPRIATVSVKPGDLVDIQSGNSFDSYWTPKAQLVVLRVREGFSGSTIVDGICMRDDGVMSLKLDCIQYNAGELFQCTRALYDHQMKRYLPANDYEAFTRLMATYAEEIESLERYTEIHKNKPAKEVTMNTATATAAASQEKIANKDREIVVGAVYDAQLGNSNDIDWAENAPILIIAKEEVKYGEQWTALAKDQAGQLHLLLGVLKYRIIDYKLYCTSALEPFQFDRYLGKTKADEMRALIEQHKDAFATLPAYVEGASE